MRRLVFFLELMDSLTSHEITDESILRERSGSHYPCCAESATALQCRSSSILAKRVVPFLACDSALPRPAHRTMLAMEALFRWGAVALHLQREKSDF